MFVLGEGNDGTTWLAAPTSRLLSQGRWATARCDAVMRAPSWRLAGPLLAISTALLVTVALTLNSALSAVTAADRPATGAAGHPGAPAGQGIRSAVAAPAVRHPAAGSPGAARQADPVGALFTRDNGQLGSHFCTASVVTSPGGDLLITAAHCVTGVSLSPPGSLVFAPGYAGGSRLPALWAVTRIFLNGPWLADQDPNDDVAFLAVRRLGGASRGTRVPAGQTEPAGSLQRATGAERIRFGARLPAQIRAIGYPDGSSHPVACSATAVAFRAGPLDQVKFYCPGFTDGTSGGPMLSDFSPAIGTGAIIGVIGGYQQGGDSPSISYSAAFTASVRALYQHALRASRPRSAS